MIGFVFLAFFIAIIGIYTWANNFYGKVGNFETTLSSSTFLFVLLIPILTMRVLAEEKHQKTDQLLYKDDKFSLTIEGEEMVGTIGENNISFDDMLGMGVKVIFAKEGTDAMDPARYLTKEEKVVIGEWAAESVEELLGDGPQTSMEGVENISDALRLNFKDDRNVAVVYKGEEIGTFPWSVAMGYCMIESENPSLSVTINDDDTLKVDYSDDEDYYTFHCVKSDSK